MTANLAGRRTEEATGDDEVLVNCADFPRNTRKKLRMAESLPNES